MAVTETQLERPETARKNGAGAPAPDRPAVTFHESARALLTPDVREVLDGVLSVVYGRARQEAVEMDGVEVYALSARDEIGEQLIVSLSVPLPVDDVFTFWGGLSDAVQEWTATLPEAQADMLAELIGLQVQGISHDAPL